MKLLLVEDDVAYADIAVEFLRERAGAEVILMTTEREFVVNLDQISGMALDAIIIDTMFPWARADEIRAFEDIPEEVRDEGYFKAGLRCAERLAQRADTNHIPIIFLTGLSRREFGLASKWVMCEKGDEQALLGDIYRCIEKHPKRSSRK